MKNLLKTTTVFAGLSLFTTFSSKAQTWNPVGATTNIYNTNTGFVGIGTGSSISPLDKLQIKGGNLLMDPWASGTGSIYFGGHTDTGANGLRLSFNSTSGAYIDSRSPLGYGIVFRVDAPGSSNTERMRITTAGDVGIGVSSPAYKLDVAGTGKFSSNLTIGAYTLPAADGTLNQVLTTNGVGLVTWKAIPAISWNLLGNTGTSASTNFIGTTDAIDFVTRTNNIEKMRVTSSGNVGINTASPSATLTVNGDVLIGDATVTRPAGYRLYVQTGILTEKVKVALATSSDWSDYVFAKDYKLRKLSDVEAYVRENKHLPGIPSAEQVVKEGIDLGKMDAKLLEKIEELTLYMISQDKKLQELELKNTELNNKITTLLEQK